MDSCLCTFYIFILMRLRDVYTTIIFQYTYILSNIYISQILEIEKPSQQCAVNAWIR